MIDEEHQLLDQTPSVAEGVKPLVPALVSSTQSRVAEATAPYRLFATEEDAYKYLDENVPPPEDDIEVDFSALKEPLFEAPDEVKPGHYEFEGKNGMKVSFDIVNAGSFVIDDCIKIYGRLADRGIVEGTFRPIYEIRNLQIQSKNFSYSPEKNSRPIKVNWMPQLHSTTKGVSYAFLNIEAGEIYTIGDTGLLATPKDILTLFHEIGHVETRTPEQMLEERRSVKRVYSSRGCETEPYKLAALELQREIHANEWMVDHVRPLFKDLNLPEELLGDHVQHAQLRTYHEANRDWLGKNAKTEDPTSEAIVS